MGWLVCSKPPTSVSSDPLCLRPQPKPVLTRIEDVTVVIFLLDYLLRIATVHAVPERCVGLGCSIPVTSSL